MEARRPIRKADWPDADKRLLAKFNLYWIVLNAYRDDAVKILQWLTERKTTVVRVILIMTALIAVLAANVPITSSKITEYGPNEGESTSSHRYDNGRITIVSTGKVGCAGGIVGRAYDSYISGVLGDIDVYGAFAGGAVGCMENSKIEDLFVEGNVAVSGETVGAVAGISFNSTLKPQNVGGDRAVQNKEWITGMLQNMKETFGKLEEFNVGGDQAVQNKELIAGILQNMTETFGKLENKFKQKNL